MSSSLVGTNGAVDLPGVGQGAYYLTVRAADGHVIHQEMVSVARHSGPLQIRVPDGKAPERPVSGTVSVARLKHKVPKEARKEYDKSQKRYRKGDLQASLQHLQKAIEIDPHYMEAHNNLGSRYMMLDQPQNALTAFQRAAELDPQNAILQANIAISYMALRDFKAAELAGRSALQWDSTNRKAIYVLGLSLYAQNRPTDEAKKLLFRVQDEFPNARFALAIMQANTGETEMARETLKGYPENAPPELRQRAQAMLASLR